MVWPSVYGRYVIGLISSAEESSPVSSLNCDRQHTANSGALQFVNGTCAGGQMGWLGMLWSVDVGLPYVTYTALHRAVRSRSVDRTEVAL